MGYYFSRPKTSNGVDMPKLKLTKKNVDSLPMPENGQIYYWDTELIGFGLRLNPKSKVYIAQVKVEGQARRDTIGPHGTFAPDKAREEARDRLQKMRKGYDPRIEKAKRKAEKLTLKDLSEQYKKDRRLKPLTLRDIDKHVNGIFSDWKDKPIINITRDTVLKRFREISENAPAQANQGFRILRALLNYARATYRPNDTPILPENPVQVLSDAKIWNENKARSGRIPIEKVGAAWACLEKQRAWPGNTQASKAAIDLTAFIMFTGCRLNEGASLTWDRINLEAGTWHLPDPKNHQPVTFPLSSQAQQIIEERPRITDFVFPGRSPKGHILEIRRPLKKISEQIGTRITAHDLRRTFTAIAGKCGLELWRVKLLMNHKLTGDVTLNNYTEKTDLRYLQPEIQKIGDLIEQQGAIAQAGNIIDLQVHREAKESE